VNSESRGGWVFITGLADKTKPLPEEIAASEGRAEGSAGGTCVGRAIQHQFSRSVPACHALS